MNQEGQAPLEFERDHLAERCQERRSCAWGQAYLPAGLAWELRRPQRSLAPEITRLNPLWPVSFLNHYVVTSPGAFLYERDGRRAFLTQNLWTRVALPLAFALTSIHQSVLIKNVKFWVMSLARILFLTILPASASGCPTLTLFKLTPVCGFLLK